MYLKKGLFGCVYTHTHIFENKFATTYVVYHRIFALVIEDTGDISLGFPQVWTCKKKWSRTHFIILVRRDTCHFLSR